MLRGVRVPPGLGWGDVQGDGGLYGMESLWKRGGSVQQPGFEHNPEPVLRPCGERGARGVGADKQRGQFLCGEFLDGDTSANHKGLRSGQDGGRAQACVPCVQDDVLPDVRVHAAACPGDAVCFGAVAQGRSRKHRGLRAADVGGRAGHFNIVSDNDARAGDGEDRAVSGSCRRASALQPACCIHSAETRFSAVFGHGGAGGDRGACDRRPPCRGELALAFLAPEVRRQGGAPACPRRCTVGVDSVAHCVEIRRVVPAVFRHGGFKHGEFVPIIFVCRAGQGREENGHGVCF